MSFQSIGVSFREEGRRYDVHLYEVENEQPDLEEIDDGCISKGGETEEGVSDKSVGCWQKVRRDQGPEVVVGFCYKEALVSLAVLCEGGGTKARSRGVQDSSFRAGAGSVFSPLCP